MILPSDLTPDQRQERREKVNVRRESQRNTGRPGSRKEYANAAKLPIGDVQLRLSEHEAVEMQVEHKIPRLIERNLILQLSH